MAQWKHDLEFSESTVSLAEQWSVWSCVTLRHLRIMAFGVISFLRPFSLLTFLPISFHHSTLVLFTVIRCHVSQLDSDLPFLSGRVKIIQLIFLVPIFSFFLWVSLSLLHLCESTSGEAANRDSQQGRTRCLIWSYVWNVRSKGPLSPWRPRYSFWPNVHHVSLKVLDRVNNAKVHNSRAPFTHLWPQRCCSLWRCCGRLLLDLFFFFNPALFY